MSHKAIPDTSDEYCGTSYAAKLLNLSVGTVQTLVEKTNSRLGKPKAVIAVFPFNRFVTTKTVQVCRPMLITKIPSD